jgi:large subunit ribosomal protein L24
MKIKKGDMVKVLTGASRGKTGKVLMAFPSMEKVLVEGVNIKKRHERARKQNQKGQIVERPAPVHVSNVKRV